jgi:hypothetical protein
MGEMRNPYTILVGKPERKRPHGRSRYRLKDNIRRNLRGVGWEGVDWMHMTEGRDQWWALVNVIMNFQVP